MHKKYVASFIGYAAKVSILVCLTQVKYSISIEI